MFWQAFLASLAACTATTAGIFTISRFPDWTKRHAVYFMSFAAGMLITVSFLHLVPRAAGMNTGYAGYLAPGFFALYFLDRLLRRHAGGREDRSEQDRRRVPVVGIGIHSFIDGLIYLVTFKVDVLTGLLAATGMVLHEFPEGVVSFVLLNRAGIPSRRSFVYAFLAAGLSTPIGVLVGYVLLGWIGTSELGLALGFSAGALVYAGAVHLMPAVEREDRKYTLTTLGLGVLIAVTITRLAP